jgi:tetratricopeptide (TPR) repeat protein
MARLRVRIGGALLLAGLLTQAEPSRADKSARPPVSKPAATPPVSKSTATTASADSAPPNLAPKLDLDGPEAEAKERARVLFLQGVAAYRDGKFYDAVAIFLQTQRIYPDTQLCFNIARAYENLGNGSAALRYYRDYLRQADRPSDGEEVRDRVRRLQQQVAQRGVQQLTVLSQPESATVLLDGKPVGIAPWTGETYPGKHRLALTLDGHAAQEQVIEVDAYEARDVSLVLVPVPKLTPAPAPVVVFKQRQPGVSIETLITLGTGLVLLGSAIAAEAASNQPGMSRTTAFLAGGGLGVSGVGGVMLYFDLSPRADASIAPSRGKDSAQVRP